MTPAILCAVCFGDPNSLASRGLIAAIFLLVAVVAGVLSSIAWTALTWSRRSKKLGA